MEFTNREVGWHTDILPRNVKPALDYFSRQNWLRRSAWYLAGGTALSLQVGHRTSADLDFFIPKGDFGAAKLIKKLPKDKWTTGILREGTIYGKFLTAKVSFIAYPFFVAKQPFKWYGAVRVLDPHDITVMKIVAVSQRGRKRDFIDLYWYCLNHEPLIDIIQCLPEQYPNIAHNYHHILKSLAYFEDAEADPMPKVFFDADWKKIKKFFERETKLIAQKLLKL